MKRKTLTPEQKKEIIRMREDLGWTYKRISTELGVSRPSVQWYCLMEGLDPPDCKKATSPKDRSQYNYMRNGKPVRAFTKEEDRLLLQMDLEGLNYSEMGRRLKRKHNSIQGRMATLARLEERKAKAVEK